MVKRSMTTSLSRHMLVMLGCFGFCRAAIAQEQAGDQESKPKSKAEQRMDESLERYKVFFGDDDQPLVPRKVLTWNNPIARGFGKFRTVLFLKDGQPKVACCIWGSQNIYHEFGSLSRVPVRGELDGSPSWKMPASAERFKTIPDADPPAADRRRRLLQMKKLVGRFEAIEMENRKRQPDKIPLRQLTTPLFRYEGKVDNIVDGAVFCFVHTTDPEALLLIEAIESKDGRAMHWEYAFVRRTSLPVTGRLDDQEVWNTDTVGFRTFNQLPYIPNR